MLIRSINESDNKSLSRILREVLVEMEIPKKGSAYEDPELDKMFEAYQNSRSIYYICLLYTSPSPRDISGSRMPSSA